MAATAESIPRVAAEVASTARLLAAAGLVEAFGHVSARDGAHRFTITATTPLGAAADDTVLGCDAAGEPVGSGAGLPLETPLHAAIYASRPDVGAIARVHGSAIVAAGARPEVPAVAHGLGGLSGRVASWTDPQLVIDGERAAAAAAALGPADCLLIRGNGAVVTAPDLARAAVRAWFLEERCRVYAAAGTELSAAELDERSAHYPAETARAWAWLRWRFGDGRE